MPTDRFERLVLGTNLTGTDNADGSITIDAAGGGGGSAHVIEDEGTPLTQRANLNFVGAGVTVTDSSPDTIVTIPRGGDWDTEVVKATTDTVTNSITLTDDSELVAALAATTIYLVDVLIIYSGNNTTGDYKWQFTFPAIASTSASSGWYITHNVAIQQSIGMSTTAWPGAAVNENTDATHEKRSFMGQFILTTIGAGNLHFQFANAAAAVGRESKTWAGSRVRLKVLYP